MLRPRRGISCLAMHVACDSRIMYAYLKGKTRSSERLSSSIFPPSTSLIDVFHPRHEAEDEDRKELKHRLLLFHKTLRQLHLSSLDIAMYENHEITLKQALLRLISTWTALALQIPLFLPGIIINSPIYLLARVAEHFEKYTESVSQDKVVLSVVTAIPLYGTLFYKAWQFLDYSMTGFLLAVALMPILAWYHMALVDTRYDMAKQVMASWRICVAVLSSISGFDAGPRHELDHAVQLRRWCHVHTRTLLLELAESGDPHARYLVDYGQPLFQKT